MYVVARSNKGLVRTSNEDRFLKGRQIFAVADGMGGQQAGEVASTTAIDLLRDVDLSTVRKEVILSTLRNKIECINDHIYDLSRNVPEYRGMGTTLTVIYLDEKEHRAYVGHVGDSRLYVYQGGVLRQLTSDHSMVAEKVRRGELTKSEAEEHDERNILLRAVGAFPEVKVDTFSFLTQGIRYIMLCSDGLTGMVSEMKLNAIIREHDNIEEMTSHLLGEALRSGGSDNVTVVMIDVERKQ